VAQENAVEPCGVHDHCAHVFVPVGQMHLAGEWHFTLLEEVLRINGPSRQEITRDLTEFKSVENAVAGAVPGLVLAPIARDVVSVIVGS
jgi:hypothetical protein